MVQQQLATSASVADRLFGRFIVNHERVSWKLTELPWDRIQRDQLDAATVAAVRAAMLVESHNPVFAATLLTKFRYEFDMAGFLAIWTYEEFKHFVGLKAYLEAAEAAPRAELEAELTVTRRGEWLIPDRYTGLMMATYAMVQELVTGIFYKNFALRVREPVLRELLLQIGKDEYRHCQFYFDYAKRVLDEDRSQLEEVDEALLEFEMPGPSFVPDYERHGQAMLVAASPGPGAFREVLTKVGNLVGKLHLMRLAGNAAYRRRLQDNWGMDPRLLLRFGY